MCFDCQCLCGSSFEINLAKNAKIKMAQLYEGIEVVYEKEPNFIDKYYKQCHLSKTELPYGPKAWCEYDGEPSTMHSLYQTLLRLSQIDNIDVIWYIGEAFYKCKFPLQFKANKIGVVQQAIEKLIIKYHDDFVLTHRHFGSGLNIIASYLFDNDGKIRRNHLAPARVRTIKKITDDNQSNMHVVRRKLIF